ncbi:TonB-dependent receptor [Anthocerotibacter panamensis]|uniref:TonB-dependent receptor n=1 Tax=Anthocerotibacter panamensis TaxID=2857077 RepID=UPI001C404806|nr:TonB-dependent receptor [Anthocerotibacter panamensis]
MNKTSHPRIFLLLIGLLLPPVWAEPMTVQQLRQEEKGIQHLAQALQNPVDDDTPDTLAEYTVTANRVPKPIRETPESVTVITRSDIEALTPLARDLPGLLRIVPGLQAGGTSPFEPSFSIRGLGDGRSAVFIDGERQNVSQGDARTDLFSVNPQDIERIEVLRGPASGTYGADAAGGLINVITRQPKAGDPAKFGFQTVFGGFSTFDQTARLSTAGEGFALQAGVSYRSVGDAVDGLGVFAPNQQDSQTYTAQLRLFANPDNRITFKYASSRLHTGVLLVSNFAEGERFTAPLLAKDRFGIEWSSQKVFGSATNLKLNVYYNQLFQNFIQRLISPEDETVEFDQRSTSSTNTLGTNLQFTTPVGSGALTYGIDFYTETGTNASLIQGEALGSEPSALPTIPDGNQTGIAGYLLLDYPITEALVLNGGIRYDTIGTTANPGDLGPGQALQNTALTPKVGLVWSVAPGLRLRANYSQGFRVPSFRERFFQGFAGPLNADLDDVVLSEGLNVLAEGFAYLRGNPSLDPLRSTSLDLGIGGGDAQSSWDVVYFNNNVTGLLNLAANSTFGPVPLLEFTNIDARFQGVEAQGSLQISPEWRLRGSFTWTDAIERTTGRQLATVAPTSGALQLSYRSPAGISALLQARVSSERFEIPSFGVLDLNLAVPISPALQLTFTVSNLLDSLIAESLPGKYSPGRQFFIGIRSGDF